MFLSLVFHVMGCVSQSIMFSSCSRRRLSTLDQLLIRQARKSVAFSSFMYIYKHGMRAKGASSRGHHYRLPGLRLLFLPPAPAPRLPPGPPREPPAGGLTKAKSALRGWSSNVSPLAQASMAALASACVSNSMRAYPYDECVQSVFPTSFDAQRTEATHLDVTSASVEIEMAVVHLTKVGELVEHFLLGRLLVDVGDNDNPSFDSCESFGTTDVSV